MILEVLLLLQVAAQPELVAPGVLNTDADEYGPTLTADGRTMYFTLRADRRGRENIVMSRLEGTQWSNPVPVSFSGNGEDKEPYLSPDGRRLFFSSRRSYEGKAPAQGEEAHDLFVVERSGTGWGTPRPVGPANSAAYDNYPAVAASGTLYFSSHRLSSRNAMFRSRYSGNAWQPAEPITELNNEQAADPFIAPDESYLVYSSTRAGGAGQGDLYVTRQRNGRWSEPVSLGPPVNSPDYEYTPWVTADGRWLYFSRGWGEIWRIEISKVPALNHAGG